MAHHTTNLVGSKKREKLAATSAPAEENLSRLIDQLMEKQENEQVKTVHLFGQFYRCNWWVRDPDSNSLFARTGRISRSCMLRAERDASGALKITEIPDKRPEER